MKPASLIFCAISSCVIGSTAVFADTMSDDDVVRLMKPTDPVEFIARFKDICMAHPGDYWATANYALDQGLHVGDDFLQGTGIPGYSVTDDQTFYTLDGQAAPFMMTIGQQGETVVCMLLNMNTFVAGSDIDALVAKTGGFAGQEKQIEKAAGAGRVWTEEETGNTVSIASTDKVLAVIFAADPPSK